MRSLCQDGKILDTLLSGTLADPEARRLESHLLQCASCIGRLSPVGGTDRVRSPVVDPGDVWGSAIACVVFGPDELSREDFVSLRAILRDQGFTVAAVDERHLWAAFDVSSGLVTGDPVDAARLVSFLRRLGQIVRADGFAGAIVDVGRGRLDRWGPSGAVFDQLATLSDQVQVGELLMTEEVCSRVEELGISFQRRTSELPRVVPMAERPSRVRRPTSSLGNELRGWWGGALPDLTRIGARSAVARARRASRRRIDNGDALSGSDNLSQSGLTPSVRTSRSSITLEPGDNLVVHYESPTEGWLYLLSLQGGSLSVLNAGSPIRTPADAERGEIQIEPQGVPGPLKLYLLITHAPLRSLVGLCENLTPNLSDPDGALVQLGEMLMSIEGLESFLLLDAGTFALKSREARR